MGNAVPATTKQNQTKQLAEEMGKFIELSRDELTKLLPPTMDFERLKEIMIYNFKITPQLLTCSPQSVMKSVFALASMGLEPHPQLGEAYIIPYKNEATVQIGYKGFVRLAMNSGEIKSINCEVVRENDFFDHQLGTGAFLKHKIDFRISDDERGKAIAYYCVVTFKNGSEKFEIMSLADVKKIQAKSPAGRSGPWMTHFDEMAKKTVFRRAFKWLPKSINRQFEQAIVVDNAGFNGDAIEVEATESGIDIWAEEKTDDTPRVEQSDESERLNNLLDSNQQKLLEGAE